MYVALTYVAVSIGALLFLTFIYVIEDVKGDRVFFLGLRNKLDRLLTSILNRIELFMLSLSTGIVRILLHYGAHSVLKQILAFIRSFEQRLEALVQGGVAIEPGDGEMLRIPQVQVRVDESERRRCPNSLTDRSPERRSWSHSQTTC